MYSVLNRPPCSIALRAQSPSVVVCSHPLGAFWNSVLTIPPWNSVLTLPWNSVLTRPRRATADDDDEDNETWDDEQVLILKKKIEKKITYPLFPGCSYSPANLHLFAGTPTSLVFYPCLFPSPAATLTPPPRPRSLKMAASSHRLIALSLSQPRPYLLKNSSASC